MDKNAWWKWSLLFVFVVGSLGLITPIDEKLQKGIDLQGGTSFLVEIDQEELIAGLERDNPDRWVALAEVDRQMEIDEHLDGVQERSLEVIRNRVDALGTAEPVIYPEKNNRIVVQLPAIDDDTRREAEDAIQRAAFLALRLVHIENDKLVDELLQSGESPDGYTMVDLGGRRYYQAVPGFRDTMDRGAFKSYRKRLARWRTPSPTYDFMLAKQAVGQSEVYAPYFVDRRIQLTGQYLTGARVEFGGGGLPVVGLTFDDEGAEKFGQLTEDYSPGGPRNQGSDRGRLMAIVLDGTLYSAPHLNEPIYGGRAQISGSFSYEEARFLANILKSGSLPVPMEIVETRSVSPTLGQDAVDRGLKAIIYGGAMVLVFMLLYYMVAGVVANVALLLNMILLPLGAVIAAGFLALFSSDASSGGSISLPVLTLPGIAGILLTIGMAVDANVLIFERIREEISTGKRLGPAIGAGYGRAFITILDANLTTLLTGIILFIFGSGPIRGFAVMLCAGIIVSMYTALVVTRMFFHVLVKNAKLKKLKMLSIVGQPKINFIGKRGIALACSTLLIVGTWGTLISKGSKDASSIFAVDFTGGSSVSFLETLPEGQDAVDLAAVRTALEGAGLTSLVIQEQAEVTGDQKYLVVKTPLMATGESSVSKAMTDALDAEFPGVFSIASEDDVGPQVGGELQWRALKAIIVALIGIVIYITIRFEFGFAIGAIAALVHDVLVTVGIYVLFGRQLSLPVVAAVLTIVGYSVNDTIVVFDRIREDLRSAKHLNFPAICNLSINQTLSRTLLTSTTTLLAVVMLLVFGGGAIFDFALTLCIGVLVGTYSSIFVATPAVLAFHKGEKPDLAVKAVQAA